MNRKKLVILTIVAALIALFFYFDLGRYLTLESLKANRLTLVRFHDTHRVATAGIFMAVYIVQTALSLPGAAILSLAAGAVFGAAMGTIYSNIAATLGATLAFLVARYLFRNSIQSKFGVRLSKLNTELEQRGLNYLLFLRLVPVFPFFLINLGAGLTKLPLRTFFFGTMFGIIPGGFVYCNAGASLASINSMREIASPRVLGSFALLGLFALVPVFYQKLKARKRESGIGDQQ
ncbi:TVP38/TMEM64 family protein [Geotalea uraniireducens]|nr:TVP38/TMEM64 family protein [Geotalea uraniireducens]